MRGNTDDEDSPETPLLGDNDAVVTIINSDNESPTTRSARRTKSTSDRIRNRNPSLLGARRTPSNLFKNSNDTDTQNEVGRRSLQYNTYGVQQHPLKKQHACYLQLELDCADPVSDNICCLPQNSDIAFTIVVNRQADDDEAGEVDEEEDPDNTNNNRMEVDFVQEAVQEAIQEAVQDAVQEVCNTNKLTKH